MAKQISGDILDAVLRVVQWFPKGASLEDVLQGLISSVPWRSLQRYLAFLTRRGRLTALDRARARRYYGAIPENEKMFPLILRDAPLSNPKIESLIPLSSTALSLQAHLKQPIQARRPVGYNREFLDQYRPNETYYLSEKIRNHLFEWENRQRASVRREPMPGKFLTAY